MYCLCTYLGICFCVCPFFNTMCFFKCSRLELGRWVSFDGYFQVMASKRYKLIRYRNMTGRVWIWILKFHLWWMNLLKYLYGFWFILCKRWGVLHSFNSMNTEHIRLPHPKSFFNTRMRFHLLTHYLTKRGSKISQKWSTWFVNGP